MSTSLKDFMLATFRVAWGKSTVQQIPAPICQSSKDMASGANTTSVLPYYLPYNYLRTSPVKVEKMQLLKSGLVSQTQLLKDVKSYSNQYPEPCFQQENAKGSKLGHQELTTDDIRSLDTFLPRRLLQLKMGRLGDRKEQAQMPEVERRDPCFSNGNHVWLLGTWNGTSLNCDGLPRLTSRYQTYKEGRCEIAH